MSPLRCATVVWEVSMNHSLPSAQRENGRGSRDNNHTGRTVEPPLACEACAASAARFAVTHRRTSTTCVISCGAEKLFATRATLMPPGRTLIRCRRRRTRRSGARSTVAASTTGVPARRAAA